MTLPKDQETVDTAFGMIRSAATLLSAFPYADAAASLRQQEDVAWFTNPTMMQQYDRDDFRRKLRLLDAAATFVKEWEAVKEEALAADPSDKREGDDGP